MRWPRACCWRLALAYPPLAWTLMEPLGHGAGAAGLAFAMAHDPAGGGDGQGWVVLAGGAGFTPRLRVPLQRALFGRILVGRAGRLRDGDRRQPDDHPGDRAHRLHGAAAVAAYGISARMEFLMIPLAFGVGSALTALVGRAVGAGDWAEARRTAWTGGRWPLGVTGAVGLSVTLFPEATARAFTADPEVRAIATTALSMIGPGACRASASAWRLFRLDGRGADALAGGRGARRGSPWRWAAAGCWRICWASG